MVFFTHRKTQLVIPMTEPNFRLNQISVWTKFPAAPKLRGCWFTTDGIFFLSLFKRTMSLKRKDPDFEPYEDGTFTDKAKGKAPSKPRPELDESKYDLTGLGKTNP